MNTFDEKYCLDTFEKLLSVDSTTGMYEDMEALVCDMLDDLGYPYQVTRKGGVIADLGGRGDPLVVTAHLDAIGLMVRRINSDGTLNVCPVGGLYPVYCVTENVRVHTADGEIYTGTVCRTPGSVHVTEDELKGNLGDFRSNVCVVLDRDVKNPEDVRALGIECGDYVALEPRMTVSGGYVKSRFIDDKACAAVLFTLLKEILDMGLVPSRKVYFYFAFYEEIGHGTTWLPDGVCDILAVDIAPTGPDQTSDEHKVSVFAKDSRYPYHFGMLRELTAAARRAGVDYVVDVITPHYGSDGDATVAAGYDVRHGAIGPGTLNSHGYERTHVDGLRNTYCLLKEYILG